MTGGRPAAGGDLMPRPVAAGTNTTIAGLDVVSAHERDADAVAVRLARSLPPAWAGRLLVATHVERSDPAHITLSLELPADADSAWSALAAALGRMCLAERSLVEGPLVEGALGEVALAQGALVAGRQAAGPAAHVAHARAAAAAHAARAHGRAVVVPGAADLPGALTVGELLTRTAIDRVLVLGGGDARADAVLVTRGFLRPRWSTGELVLHVQPAAGGVLVPFETADPTPCCADH